MSERTWLHVRKDTAADPSPGQSMRLFSALRCAAGLWPVSCKCADGMKLAGVSTGGDPGHAPARRAYEKAGYTAFPNVWYYQPL